MAKRKRKSYSLEEKFLYHDKRSKDSNVSKNKKMYSWWWCRWFKDTRATDNTRPLKQEHEDLKKSKKQYTKEQYRNQMIISSACINGNRSHVKGLKTGETFELDRKYDLGIYDYTFIEKTAGK